MRLLYIHAKNANKIEKIKRSSGIECSPSSFLLSTLQDKMGLSLASSPFTSQRSVTGVNSLPVCTGDVSIKVNGAEKEQTHLIRRLH